MTSRAASAASDGKRTRFQRTAFDGLIRRIDAGTAEFPAIELNHNARCYGSPGRIGAVVSLGRYPVDRLAFVGLLFDCEASRMLLATYSGQRIGVSVGHCEGNWEGQCDRFNGETLNCSNVTSLAEILATEDFSPRFQVAWRESGGEIRRPASPHSCPVKKRKILC